MYGTRYVVRPTCGRVARMASPSTARNLSYIPAPFYPRFSASSNSFGSELFKFLDDSSRAFDNFFPQSLVHHAQQQQQQVFAPRFDIREIDGAYQLRGELPGVEAHNLEVQFVDPKTLIISGRTERESSSDTPPASLQASEPVTQVENSNNAQDSTVDNSDTASVHSSGSNFQKASVEDDYVDAGEEASTSAAARTAGEATVAATPAEAPVPSQSQQAQSQTSNGAQAAEPQNHYWVSERSVGSFSRTFNFPANVDQDAVTASLKNGILDIFVPKAKVPEPRRISVL